LPTQTCGQKLRLAQKKEQDELNKLATEKEKTKTNKAESTA
jgi:hypothetical protein